MEPINGAALNQSSSNSGNGAPLLNKNTKDGSFSPSTTSPPQQFNFQSYNINIRVQHYEDKQATNTNESPQTPQELQEPKNEGLAEIQEDNSENTPQTIITSNFYNGPWKKEGNSNEDAQSILNNQNNFGRGIIGGALNINSAFNSNNSMNAGDLYDQRLGAVKRGKLFTLQDLESFGGGKEKQEQDEIVPLTDEFIESKSVGGWGSGKDISFKKVPSMQEQLLKIKHEQSNNQANAISSNLPKKDQVLRGKSLQSKNTKNYVVTIRTPDMIWKEKFFFIMAFISRIMRKMKQVNIFRHPEQLYANQLNAINDKAAKTMSDQDWGVQEDDNPQPSKIPTISEWQARRKYKYFLIRYRKLRKWWRTRTRPMKLKYEKFKVILQQYLRSFEGKISTFDQMSWFVQLWQNCLFFLSIAIIIYLPYEYSFEIHRDFPQQLLFNYILPIIFFVNIFINANTSIFLKGNIITERTSIIKRYVKTTLLIDILSSLSLLAPSTSEFTFFFYLRGFLYIHFINKLSERFLLYETLFMIAQFVQVMFNVLIVNHFAACIWYLIGNNLKKHQGNGWLYIALNDSYLSSQMNSSINVYFLSLLTITSNTTLLESSNLSIQNTKEERFFLIGLGFVGVYLLAYVFYKVKVIYSQREKQREEYLLQLKQLSNYLNSHDVERQLKDSSKKYLELMYVENQENQTSTQECLDCLSNYLKQEIVKDVFLKATKKINLFKKYFSYNHKFLEKLALKSIEVSFGPDELIMRQGLTDDPQIYFVTHGEIQLFVEMGSKANVQQKIFKTMRTGQCFGLFEFFSSNQEVQLSAKSVGVSRVLVVSLEDMRELLKEYPKEREAFCFLRDSITFKNDLSQIGLECYSCKQVNHYVHECPYLFYGTQPQKVIKEINKAINHIILTFHRSLKRKKFRTFTSQNLVEKKVDLFVSTNREQLMKSEEFGGEEDDEDDNIDEYEEEIESSDSSVQYIGQTSGASNSEENHGMNQSRFDKERKSILRVHSGSQKISTRPRHKESIESNRDREAIPRSVSISKFGRKVKLSDASAGQQEEISELKNSLSWHTRERPISLSNNYEVNTVGRINSAEFFNNNDDSKRLQSVFKRSESEKQGSYENILDRGEIGEEEGQPEERTQNRHSTNQTNKTNKTNKTSKTTLTKALQQLDMDNHSLTNSLQKTNSASQEGVNEGVQNNPNNTKVALLETNTNISPIHGLRKESQNSNSLYNNTSSNILLQLINTNNAGSSPSVLPIISNVNNNNLNTSNLPSSSSNNINLDKIMGGLNVNSGSNAAVSSNLNSNPNYYNIPSSLVNNIPNSSILPNSSSIQGNIASFATNNMNTNSIIHQNSNSLNNHSNTITQKQNSGNLNQQYSQSFTHSTRLQNQHSNHLFETRLSHGAHQNSQQFETYSASIGTVKSFELYFPQNNIENIIEHYNKLQRKKVSRRARKKHTTTLKPTREPIKKRSHFTALISKPISVEQDARQLHSLTNLDHVNHSSVNKILGMGNIPNPMNTQNNTINSFNSNSNSVITSNIKSSVKKEMFSIKTLNLNEPAQGVSKATSLKMKS